MVASRGSFFGERMCESWLVSTSTRSSHQRLLLTIGTICDVTLFMYREQLATLSLFLIALQACAQSDFPDERESMVEQVIQLAALMGGETGRPQFADRVIDALRTVPRHEFVPEALRGAVAYRNSPLPIGNGQTISQPYIVALMTDLADAGSDSVVLEIGTGSGYQAAVLAEFVDHVYTIEIIEPLGRRAAETLERLDYSNVSVRIGDGYLGWPEFAPFDAILVTAAPEEVPEPLIQQLKPSGRLVIPVGPEHEIQSLRVLEKTESGQTRVTDVLPVRFVPFLDEDDVTR